MGDHVKCKLPLEKMKVAVDLPNLLALIINSDYGLVAFGSGSTQPGEPPFMLIAKKDQIAFMGWLGMQNKSVEITASVVFDVSWYRKGTDLFFLNTGKYYPITKEVCEAMLEKRGDEIIVR